MDLELDEKCREEVSALILRCTSLGRAVVISSQVPVRWVVWGFLAGVLIGLFIACLICWNKSRFSLPPVVKKHYGERRDSSEQAPRLAAKKSRTA